MSELADIIRLHGPEYTDAHSLSTDQWNAYRAILSCRTPVRGGRVYTCKKCKREDYSYHSCKNRACPKCLNQETTAWIEQQRALLPPGEYFLVTTTLPHSVHPVARQNFKKVLSAFFNASGKAVIELASDPRFLGGKPGALGVIQTWERYMRLHIHVHFLVPAGALLSSRHHRWIRPKKSTFLIHEQPLGLLVRGKFKDAMKEAGLFDAIPKSTWTKDWVSDCKHIGSSHHALKYLAPYIYRTAISNKRIVSLHNGIVTFKVWHREQKRYTLEQLSASRFLERFLQHVMPKGLQRVRYFGLLHSSNRALLNIARFILGKQPYVKPQKTQNPNKAFRPCPHCGGELFLLGNAVRGRGPP